DSDHDGLRDDLQRYVALTYSGQASTVTALNGMARMLQSALVDAGSENSSVNHANDMVRVTECLRSVRAADAGQVASSLLAQTINTEARLKAYLRFNEQLRGQAFPMKASAEWATSCGSGLTGLRGLITHLNASVCGGSDTTVFYGNGVLTTFEEAQDSLA